MDEEKSKNRQYVRYIRREQEMERRRRQVRMYKALIFFMLGLTVLGAIHTWKTSRRMQKAGGKQEKTASKEQDEQTQNGLTEEEQIQGEQMQEEKTKEETVEKLPAQTEILMSFTGDCILGTDENFLWETGFNAYYESYGGAYFFQNVKHIFEADDLTIVNMEGTLTEETTREYKQFAFKGEPRFVDILTNGSVEAANMANNHSHDYGQKSFEDTVSILEQNNIRTFGYDDIAVMEVKGVKVGMFGIYELDDHLERIPQLQQNIAKLKARNVDIIVGVFHWSNELVTVPDANQITLGHMAVELGADIVVGHHPHVVQGIEEYQGKTIAYSLGNFCFGGNTHPQEMDTMILQQKFVLSEDREIIDTQTTVIPCSVSSDISYNNYQPTVLEGDAAASCMERIDSRSAAITY